jgi:hypothetical protein
MGQQKFTHLAAPVFKNDWWQSCLIESYVFASDPLF